MQQYIAIPKVIETDFVVNRKLTLKSNIASFHEGDIVSVTELIEGLQSELQYDSNFDSVIGFDNKYNTVSKDNSYRGFYDYIKHLDAEPFKRYANYTFYGQWMIPNNHKYDSDNLFQFYLFDIYDNENNKWLSQNFVKGFSTKYQIKYTHELYFGPFLGWDHIYGLLNMPAYGKYQKGVVIKNQTLLDCPKKSEIAVLKAYTINS